MKLKVLTVAACLIFSLSTGFAAPLNDLSAGQTALGIGTNTIYLEHNFNDSFTIGFQNESINDGPDMNDVYGQIKLTDNLRAIIGNRSFSSTSRLYAGLGLTAPLSSECGGYASFIGGDKFKELQLGANCRLNHATDLNIGYYSYMPDYGSNKTGLNAGVTFKF